MHRAPRPRLNAHLLAAAGLSLFGAACGADDPVDVNGVYTLALTAGANDCMLRDWMMGRSYTGVTFNLTQNTNDPGRATGRIEHLVWAVAARFAFGTTEFAGTVMGPTVELESLGGHAAAREANCTYTPVGLVSATLRGDTLEGTIRYQFKTNAHADCGYRNTCRTVWNFNGTRPPK